jgi:transcriptional regulator with XRE-family HTH domain
MAFSYHPQKIWNLKCLIDTYLDPSCQLKNLILILNPGKVKKTLFEKGWICMEIGNCIKRLRQQRDWSQAQFGKKLKVHQKQISKYERGITIPSVEVLIRIAQVFDVSLDYLVFKQKEDEQQLEISDRELLEKMVTVDKFPQKDKNLIKGILDTFIIKNQFQKLALQTELQNDSNDSN